VTALSRFVALMVGLVAIGGGLGGGLVMVARILTRVSASWATTNAALQELVRDVAGLVAQQSRDTDRLERRQDRLEQRQQQHETWHIEQRAGRGR
jgi:hypothetical protein